MIPSPLDSLEVQECLKGQNNAYSSVMSHMYLDVCGTRTSKPTNHHLGPFLLFSGIYNHNPNEHLGIFDSMYVLESEPYNNVVMCLPNTLTTTVYIFMPDELSRFRMYFPASYLLTFSTTTEVSVGLDLMTMPCRSLMLVFILAHVILGVGRPFTVAWSLMVAPACSSRTSFSSALSTASGGTAQDRVEL